MTDAPNPVAREALSLLAKNRLPDSIQSRALVMYSGGLDSFAILYNLLAHTSLYVHAHHIEIVNFERRDQAENDAITKQMAYLKKATRRFEFSSSRNEFNHGYGGGTDTQLTMFTAARVYTAWEGRFRSIWTGHITPPEWEMFEGAALFHAMFINREVKPQWLRPLRPLKKPEILGSVPEEARDLIWSCRTPVHRGDGSYAPCGNCHACRSRTEAEAVLSGS